MPWQVSHPTSVWAWTTNASRLPYLAAQCRWQWDLQTGWDSISSSFKMHIRELKHQQLAVMESVKQTDRRAADHPLNIGDLVYMRNQVISKSKIQDWWCSELHVVTAQPYPAIHVHAVKPFAGGQEWTISQDDLLHARTLLEVARDIPIPALDAPMPTEPHYPDQGKFWFSWPVNVGPAPASAPASTTTDIQQPVAATSIPSGTPAIDIPAAEQAEIPEAFKLLPSLYGDALQK